MGGILLLGPLQVDGGQVRERRDRLALSVLAVRRGSVVTPDEFAEAVWGDDQPPSWPKQVQICVGRLRKLLGASAIETVAGGYRLVVNGDGIDVDRFEAFIERGRLLSAQGEPDRATVAYARALALWRGRPLDELDGWLPARSEAARLEELHRSAEEDWLDARLAAGEHRAVAAEAEAFATAEPLRERRWAALALAQYRCGHQADALRSMSRARQTLVEQTGLDVGAALVELEAAILRQDPGLASIAQPGAASMDCPYKGLAFYDEDDTENFCGRQHEVEACLRRLRTTSLLVLAGPSGCGKSSLARAGLIPALRRLGRDVVVIVPGSDPLAALLDAEVSANGATLLVIDQFEELFTLGSPPAVVQEFCRRVAEHSLHRAPVVIAVRSDHVGGLSADLTLSRLAEQGLHLVAPLVGDALREAIEQPAARAGLRLEPGLADVLVRDCEGEPGALPLLSHALVETWRRRDGPVLTVEGYRASGGIRVAVARTADRLYDSLPPDQRTTLRSVLLRLVTPALDGEPVRCRVPSRTLLDDPGRERVVALLVRSRLVTSEADAFELAHEALARAWPRLQSWLDEDADGQRILRHLTAAADGWESLGRPDSELYRGARLEAALEWRATDHPDLTDLEREFLDTAAEHAQAESRALAAQARRDARLNHRLRGLLVATSILLIASLVAGFLVLRSRGEARDQRDAAHSAQDQAEEQRGVAEQQRRVAEEQRGVAEQQRRVAVGRELAAASVANLEEDPERSVLLALEAVERTREVDGTVLPEAEEGLHQALQSSALELRLPSAGGAVAWSPDGAFFVTEGPQGSGTVDVRDAVTGDSSRTLRAHAGDVTDTAFNDDGTLLATAGADGIVRIWDPRTGAEAAAIEGAGGEARGLSFSGNGDRLAAAWPADGGGVVRIIDPAAGRVVDEIESVPQPVATSFEPTDTRVAIASGAAPAAVVAEIDAPTEPLTLNGHFGPLIDIAWSPDGTSIATASADGSSRIFDAAGGTQRFALLGHGGAVSSVAWSPEGLRVATAGLDGSIKIWGLIEGDGRELFALSAHDTQRELAAISFSPDGNRLLSGDVASTSALVWHVGVERGAEVANLPGAGLHQGKARFSADDLVATGGNGTVVVWDASTWRPSPIGEPAAPHPLSVAPGVPLATPYDVERLSLDPTGQLAAVVRSEGGSVEIWDLDRGVKVATVPAAGAPAVAWSPSGERLAVGEWGPGTVRVVDRAGAEVARVEAPGLAVRSVAFASGGERLVATVEAPGEFDPDAARMVMWDWQTGAVVQTVATEAGFVVASDAGDLLAIAAHWRAESHAVEIRDASSGQLVATLAQTSEVNDLAFSADGSLVATGAADAVVRIWDARSGALLRSLRGHPAGVASVSFNDDASLLASYGVEGIIRVWALDVDDLVDVAHRRLTRGFTEDECRQFLHVASCAELEPTPSND